jgi:16S rRNA (uracil1498-N3)-methyltransferase
MPRFFVSLNHINNEKIWIDGEDALHISRSLRMKIGEEITLCDGKNQDYFCIVESITKDTVVAKINTSAICENEPSIDVTLYQGLTKGDKFDTIIQKAVELGVKRIVPVLTERCISRPNEGDIGKKLERWQKIAFEAAKQSGRGIIPFIGNIIPFKQAIAELKDMELALFLYEMGGQSIKSLINPKINACGFIIGPEGGFSSTEAELAKQNGITHTSLGKRILRAETASGCVLSCLMYETGNM